jgi:DNA (cytosine-5)-methyltransferase 1
LIEQTHYRVLKSEFPTGYTSVELFAGAGGLALGMENAGLSHLYLNEFDRAAVATLAANRPAWAVDPRDVREVDFRFLRHKVSVVSGGFPCQTFSAAGKRRGFDDPRGLLFFELARAVAGIQPMVVMCENVKGLVNHDGGRTLRFMVGTLQRMGYRVAYRVLRAQHLDVPQRRERLVIIGLHRDMSGPLLFPKPRAYEVTLRQALAGVPASEGERYSERKQLVMDAVPEGQNWRALPDSLRASYMGGAALKSGGLTSLARRLRWDEPSPTLLTKPQGKLTERCHPAETRPLTVREYARVQCFPDDWAFCGSREAQYRQIGNAVPVNLGYHLGAAAVTMLSGLGAADFDQAEALPPMWRLRG